MEVYKSDIFIPDKFIVRQAFVLKNPFNVNYCTNSNEYFFNDGPLTKLFFIRKTRPSVKKKHPDKIIWDIH